MSSWIKFIHVFTFQLFLAAVSHSQLYVGDNCTDASGVSGLCLELSQCEYAVEDLKKGIEPLHCGFRSFSPVVCCPKKKPGDISKYKCQEYLEFCPSFFPISGGTRALPGQYHHMAAIGYGNESNISWQCGGSLISEKFILTAAHCLRAAGVGPAQWVLLGTNTLINSTSWKGGTGQIHPVIQRIRHPEYKPPSKYNDIALLEIGNAVTENAQSFDSMHLHPACLPRLTENSDGYRAIATGWGRTGYFDEGSEHLLQVEVDILPTNTCQDAFAVEIETTSLLRRGLDTTMMCAGVLEGGKDTCPGDSGGPLQTSYRFKCMYKVEGITSFGKICATRNSPSVYTRVSAYIPWIESIVWP